MYTSLNKVDPLLSMTVPNKSLTLYNVCGIVEFMVEQNIAKSYCGKIEQRRRHTVSNLILNTIFISVTW